MLVRTAVLSIVFIGCLTIHADPVAPTKPIEVTTEAGSTATTNGKISVTTKAVITKKNVSFSVVLSTSGSFDYVSLDVEPDDVAPLADAIQDAASKVDGEFTKNVAGIKIETTSFGDKRVVALKSGDGGFSSDRIYLEADGANNVSELLRKSDKLREWLKDRVKALQP